MTTKHLHNESRGYEPERQRKGTHQAGSRHKQHAKPEQADTETRGRTEDAAPVAAQREIRMNIADRRPLPWPSDWTFELIEEYDTHIAQVAEQYELDVYPIQLELISAEQMMDAYASVGMPVNYRHWSFGKHFLSTEKSYRRGQMGLAYEIVINSNPCIAYLMEENTMTIS
jgi:hypothetical protein